MTCPFKGRPSTPLGILLFSSHPQKTRKGQKIGWIGQLFRSASKNSALKWLVRARRVRVSNHFLWGWRPYYLVDGDVRPTSWYSKHPSIYRILYIPNGAGFLLSRVCFIYHAWRWKHPPPLGEHCLILDPHGKNSVRSNLAVTPRRSKNSRSFNLDDMMMWMCLCTYFFMYDIQNAWLNAVAISLKILYIWTEPNRYLHLFLEAQKSQILINPFCTPHRTKGVLSQVDAGVESRRTVSLPEENRWGVTGVSEKPRSHRNLFQFDFCTGGVVYDVMFSGGSVFCSRPNSSQDFPQTVLSIKLSWDSKGPKSPMPSPPFEIRPYQRVISHHDPLILP